MSESPQKKPVQSSPQRPASRSTSVTPEDQYAGEIGDIEWSRKQLRLLTKVILVLAGAIAVLAVVAVVAILSRPSPDYLAVTDDMRIIKLTPLKEPAYTSAGVIKWSADKVVDTMSIGYSYWRKTLGSVQNDYTPEAFNLYIESLKSTGTLAKIVNQRYEVTAVPKSAPIITNEGLLNGVYTWMLKFDVIATYNGQQGVSSNQTYEVTMMVQRADLSKHPSGLVIKQINLK